MRIRSLTLIAALVTAGLGSTAQAQDAPPGFALGLTAGTTGIGINVIFEPTKYLNLRMGAEYFTISHEISTDGVTYNGTFNPESYALLADLYPFDNGLRVTAGGMVNRNQVSLGATPSGPTQIGNATYTPAQIGRLDGAITFRDLAPYAGIGYTSGRARRGWGFISDVGVMFSGPPRVSLVASGPISNVQSFVDDLERERAEVQDKIKIVKYYPVIKFGLVYHF